MRTEVEFSEFILTELSSLINDDELNVAEGKNILTDVTCIYENGKFELMHGFSQTDIVIYRELRIDVQPKNSFIRFYGDAEIRNGLFAVPYVVLELKTGDLTTDSIRSRDFVAARIKNMFPFSAYFFIAEHTKKEEKTLLRQGKSFTNYFISKDSIDSTAFKRIFDNYIQPHINNLKLQLPKL